MGMVVAGQGPMGRSSLSIASQVTRHGRPNVSRTIIMRALVPALLAAVAIPAALGQDATRSGAQSANQSSPAPSASTPNGAPSTGTRTVTDSATSASQAEPGGNGSPADATGASSANGSGATKPAPVCFKLSGRCVEVAKEGSPKVGTLARVDPRQKGPLNLAAPDVRSVMSAEELKEPLPSQDEVIQLQETQTVSVKGDQVPADVPLGFGAIWWALNHPSQAWRIFTPAE
jgi:hypothetical protein